MKTIQEIKKAFKKNKLPIRCTINNEFFDSGNFESEESFNKRKENSSVLANKITSDILNKIKNKS